MKKSKFLKKSLAMLLALMLVVAMIPLSASASAINLNSIYVNGKQVDVSGKSFEVNVSTTSNTVEVGTNEDLTGWTNKHQLRVDDPNSLDELNIAQWGEENGTGITGPNEGTLIDLKKYAVNDEVTFILYDLTSQEPKGIEERRFTMKINRVVDPADTSLTSVEPGLGVSKILNSLEDINETKIIKVLLARNNWSGSSSVVEDQDDLNATIEVKTAAGASVSGVAFDADYGYEVGADNNDKFTVASGNNASAQYTVVASYEDALTEFTVAGEKGQIIDSNNDDIPDTIIVNLPDSVLKDSNGYDLKDDPKLAVGYAVEGNVKNKVEVTVSGNTASPVTVSPDGKIGVVMTGLVTNGHINSETNAGNGFAQSYVVVTRLGKDPDGITDGAQQYYRLVVQMQKSDSTAIKSVMVNNTVADISGDPITAELPKKYYDGNGDQQTTNPASVKVVITTDPTVAKVVLNGKEDNDQNGELNATKTAKTWEFSNANLSKERILSVFAENGVEMAQTKIVATVAQDVSSASITGFYISDGVNSYPAESINNNEILVPVPYMTTKVGGWEMFATPSASAKVVGSATYTWQPDENGSMNVVLTGKPFDVINGTTELSAINLDNIANATPTKAEVSRGCIQAVAKNDETIKTTYTVKIVLEKAKEGRLLNGLHFTAQPNKNKTDRDVFYAKTDANTFKANVSQATNANHYVGTLNLKVAPSLTNGQNGNDLGITYHNVITEISKQDGAVVYGVLESRGGNLRLKEVDATTNGISDDSLTGDLIDNTANTYAKPPVYNQIVTLPEEFARQVKLGTATVATGTQKTPDWISEEVVKQYGAIYNVHIDQDIPEDEAVLKTIKVGDVTLNINADRTITGELPWSYTAANGGDVSYAKFIEFTMSDYAALFDEDNRVYFSKGDWNSDGEVDDIGEPANAPISKNANRKLLFVRNPDTDRTVKVFVYAGSSPANTEIKNLIVKGENRLTPDDSGKYAQTTYTFKLTWKPASNDTEISNFKLGNYTGVIDGHNIKVQVPYDTDVTGMVATFNQSIGSTIKVNDRVGGVELISGVTSVNYSNPVKLYVTSESGNNTVEYTVTVDEGISFSDVNPGDWFYDNVMDAAENGYVSGMGDGTYNPKGATTRAQFASMIAKAMGYTADPNVASMFPDVSNDYWGKAAINFCAQNGIISGYDDGTFQPEKAITRQEAAAILNNAFELAEKYGISTEKFPDNGVIADWAADHVYAAKAAGLMKGDADTGNFRPTSTITRAEAASILMNANRAGLIK